MAFVAFFMSTVCIAVSPVNGESADQALVSSTDVRPTYPIHIYKRRGRSAL
jgi:hypothetical protein